MARKSNEQQEKPLLALAAEAEADRVGLVRVAISRLGLHPRLAGELERIVWYLDRYADERGSKAGYEKLMQYAGLSRRTLLRRLKDLRQAGILDSRRRWGGAVNRVDWATIRRLASHPQAEIDTVSRDADHLLRPSAADSQGSAESGANGKSFAPKWREQSAKVARTKCQSGASGLSNYLEQELLPPPSPSSQFSTSWQAVEEEISKFGVLMARRCCASARTKGCSPAFVHQCLAFAFANRERWDEPAGALYYRLMLAKPEQNVADHWAKPSPAWSAQQRKAAAQQSHELRSQRVAAEQRERDDARREEQAVEQQLGALLDSLREEDIDPLLAGADDYTRGLYRRQGRAAPFVRRFLLAALAERYGLTGYSSLIRTE